jgi:hypothetical protein
MNKPGNRKVGAQVGNTNALKHGLYAKYFDKDSLKAIRKIRPDDLLQEVATFRRALALVTNVFDNRDADILLKHINAMSSAAASLNNLIRTHALLTGDYTPLTNALEETLDDVQPYQTPIPTQSTLPGADQVTGPG